MKQIPEHTPLYRDLLLDVKAFWQPLPDKPEETPDGLLRALWLTAAGSPVSVERAQSETLPDLSPAGVSALGELLNRKKSGEPLAHLTERQSFLGLELLAGPGALIPRKETEILARAALARIKDLVAERGEALVIDVCTGSGNLAFTYAHYEPKCRVFAADLTEDAVQLAKRNREFTGLTERVEIRQGDLLAPFESEDFLAKCDLVSCNPPYISATKVSSMHQEISQFEPSQAFNGGVFGVSILTKLIRNAHRFLKPDSWLCFEVGLGQGRVLSEQLRQNPIFLSVDTCLDGAGEIRAICCRTAAGM